MNESTKLENMIKFKQFLEEADPILNQMHNIIASWVNLTTVSLIKDPLNGLKGESNFSVRVGATPIYYYANMIDEIYTYKGERRQSDGKPHGQGMVVFKNGDWLKGEFCNGFKQGRGRLKTNSSSYIKYIEGIFDNGKLEGKGCVEYRDGGTLHCWFRKGVIHGLGKLFNSKCQLIQMSWYRNGIPCGIIWQFLEGNCYRVGHADTVTGQLIGDNVAFIYPDLRTCLYGTFVKEKMLLAQTCFIETVFIRDEICWVTFTKPQGPYYSHELKHSFCAQLMLIDPYKFQNCFVEKSQIINAGEGLFAKKSFKAGLFISFYNGVRTTTEIDQENDCCEYKIMDLKDQAGILDIPQFYTDSKRYCASLAHKANHSFNANSKFALFDHPRFGLIPGIKTINEITVGEEITINYGYDLEDAPYWYQNLFKKVY